MKANQRWLFLLVLLIALGGIFTWLIVKPKETSSGFNSQRAFQDLAYQVNLGPRIPGTAGHTQTIDWILAQLAQAGWDAKVIDSQVNGLTAHNILARRGKGPVTLLGAHYDTRQFADQDRETAKRKDPVPGANDGASGVAVLLELARSLPVTADKQIWLVFFDLEDQGGIGGRDFIEGSSAFAAQMTERPTKAVIVDMIGDANLNIYYEESSSKEDLQSIWKTAAGLGYSNSFIPEYKYNMIDDHTPFLKMGIPSVDLIDFDYPSWHTTSDNLSGVSEKSLKVVGDTLWNWLQH
jgi:glutaminyl-peptide cyclotransferase